MANIQVKDATGTTVYLKATGAGSNGDPFVPTNATTATMTGNVAHDAADSGNPVKNGGRARTTNITAVASDDRVDAIYDAQGRQVVAPYTIPEALVRGVSAQITGTTDTAVIAAQGAGVRIYLTHFVVFNTDSTVATQVNIKDGSTTIYSIYVAAQGGQVSVTLPAPLRLTANTALNAACVTTSAEVIVSASGFTGA